jgi:hypothetical protein
MIAPSPVYEIAAVFAGSGIAGFALVGLADLHFRSRGRAGRGLLLFGAYFLLFVFSVPLLLFAVAGMFRSWRSGASGANPPRGGGST